MTSTPTDVLARHHTPRRDPRVEPGRPSPNESAPTARPVIDERLWERHRELALSVVGVAVTVVLSVIVVIGEAGAVASSLARGDVLRAMAATAALAIVAALVYGSAVYQVTRLGYLRRRRRLPAPEDGFDVLADDERAPLTVLVPSYREEPDVAYQTVMAAALQEYPSRTVVLLIDDPPVPDSPAARRQLDQARAMPAQVTGTLARAAAPFAAAAADYERRARDGGVDRAREMTVLADLWVRAGTTMRRMAAKHGVRDHTDRLFVDQVLRSRAERHLARARRLRARVAAGDLLTDPEMRREYRAQAAIFRAQVISFERKRYVNLSHAPNKAMNLNTYIGLLGGRFRERTGGDGTHLERLPWPARADLVVAPTDYLLTLDADSILLPDYALRLVHEMERPGHERVAVAQTPYSAVPSASSRVEHVAGATTDLQYIIHQGFTHHGATYWVGANALVRHAALRDIATIGEERGFEVTRYIHDRTVIEDTESSVDLVAAGWQLHNHPERLAYSATPPDFGSLAIQRGRWANGGLIILPKLVGSLHRRRARLMESLLRVHYLVSIAAVNVGLLVLLAGPVAAITNPLLPLIALPYFALYGRDLVLCGYRVGDLLRVYTLNLVLLPVNLAGVIDSVRQIVSGQTIPFHRTPKVADRTAVRPAFVVAGYLLAAWWASGAVVSLVTGATPHAVFSAINTVLLVGGVGYFIGHRNAWADLRLGRVAAS